MNVSAIHAEIVDFKECLEKFKKLNKPKLALGVLQEILEVKSNISYKVLKETGIGKTVNGFRKCDGEIGEIAREIILEWKDLAEKVIKHKSEGAVDSSTINKQLSKHYKVKLEKDDSNKPSSAQPVTVKLEQPDKSKKDTLETKKIKAEKGVGASSITSPALEATLPDRRSIKSEKEDSTVSTKAKSKKSKKAHHEKSSQNEKKRKSHLKQEEPDESFDAALMGASSAEHFSTNVGANETDRLETHKTSDSSDIFPTLFQPDDMEYASSPCNANLEELHGSVSLTKVDEQCASLQSPSSITKPVISVEKKRKKGIDLAQYKLKNSIKKEKCDETPKRDVDLFSIKPEKYVDIHVNAEPKESDSSEAVKLEPNSSHDDSEIDIFKMLEKAEQENSKQTSNLDDGSANRITIPDISVTGEHSTTDTPSLTKLQSDLNQFMELVHRNSSDSSLNIKSEKSTTDSQNVLPAAYRESANDVSASNHETHKSSTKQQTRSRDSSSSRKSEQQKHHKSDKQRHRSSEKCEKRLSSEVCERRRSSLDHHSRPSTRSPNVSSSHKRHAEESFGSSSKHRKLSGSSGDSSSSEHKSSDKHRPYDSKSSKRSRSNEHRSRKSPDRRDKHEKEERSSGKHKSSSSRDDEDRSHSSHKKHKHSDKDDKKRGRSDKDHEQSNNKRERSDKKQERPDKHHERTDNKHERSDKKHERSDKNHERTDKKHKRSDNHERFDEDYERSDKNPKRSANTYERSDENIEQSEIRHKRSDNNHERSDRKHKRSDNTRRRSEENHERSGKKHDRPDKKQEHYDDTHEQSNKKHERSDKRHERSDKKYEQSGKNHEGSGIKRERLDIKEERSDMKHEQMDIKQERSHERLEIKRERSEEAYVRSSDRIHEKSDQNHERPDIKRERLDIQSGQSAESSYRSDEPHRRLSDRPSNSSKEKDSLRGEKEHSNISSKAKDSSRHSVRTIKKEPKDKDQNKTSDQSLASTSHSTSSVAKSLDRNHADSKSNRDADSKRKHSSKKHKKDDKREDKKHSGKHRKRSPDPSKVKTEKNSGSKEKMSDSEEDSNNGPSFEEMMTGVTQYVDQPKKKKPPTFEQKIARTVAKAPLPESYLDDMPELVAEYKPAPRVNQGFQSTHKPAPAPASSNTELEFKDIKAASRSDAVYSGRRRGYLTMHSLKDICIGVLGNHIDDIEYVGGVPYFILEPVLKKATPKQLLTIEDYNADFTQDSDPLWKEHVTRDFKGQKPEEFEAWRELYLRKFEEREQKFAMLQNKIHAKEQLKQSEAKRSMVAYSMSSLPKPPREVRRQQARYGTGSGTMESTARASAIMKHENNMKAISGPSRSSSHRSPRVASESTVKVISVPPLMKKAKRFMSKLNR